MTNGSSFSKSSAPWLVKFHSTGDLQVLNGSSYGADNTINWVSGSTYHFRVVVNLTAGTYSVYVTPPGQGEQTLATNYAFQVSASTLNNWGMQDTASSLVVCNFAD
jgi:unsaturated chondroitin disaccharide hydrolase